MCQMNNNVIMENNLYNPAVLTKESLIEKFVVRTNVFEQIFRAIESPDHSCQPQHFLIQGQRGMGKTTLLLRLKYEIENTNSIKESLLPVFFNEESYELSSLSNLWEKLLKYLDDLWETGGKLYEHTDDFVDDQNYEILCFNYLIENLALNNKKLVIFFDNFGQLFLEHLKEKEKVRFGEILNTNEYIRIVAASAIVLDNEKDRSQPFYDFFKIIALEGLNKEETFHLISSVQEKADVKIDLQKSRPKIEALSVLTGGVIRTLMMIYEVLLVDEDGSALQNLETVLDRITPLYKHRIEDLPLQQRKIINVIAKQWDAVGAKDIAAQIREDGKAMSSKIISAQLQHLEKNNVIEKKATNNKNNLYQVKERFFNIWYLMRNGDRKDKRRVKWLTKFLELWYDDEAGFDQFLSRHIEFLKSGKYHAKSALLLSEALANSDKLNVMTLDSFLHATAEILNAEQRKHLPNITYKKFDVALNHYLVEQYPDVIRILESIGEKNFGCNLLLAISYASVNEFDKAIASIEAITLPQLEMDLNSLLPLHVKIYLMANRPEQALSILENTEMKKDGLYYKLKGDALKYSRRENEAESSYLESIKLKHLGGYSALAELYIQEKKLELAEKCFLESLENSNTDLRRALRFFALELPGPDSTKKARDILAAVGNDKIEKDPNLLFYKALLLAFDDSKNRSFMGEDSIKILEKSRSLYDNFSRSSEEYLLMINILLYQYSHVTRSKKKSLELLSVTKDSNNWAYQWLSAFVLVWDGRPLDAVQKIKQRLSANAKSTYNEDFEQKSLNDVLLLLMAKKEFKLLLELFMEFDDLREIYKPTYYVLMSFLRKEYPNEILKMGKELEVPVTEIIQRIKEMRSEYR
jgi:Holliday junction resolvasome RuvABC ATP-dependent DNA helicase subunit